MDKDFMVERVTARLEILQQHYKYACAQRDRDGNPCTYGAAKEIRTHTLRDIRILKLILILLQHCSNKMFIDDAEAEAGFDRLVEPVHRKK